QRGHPRRRGRGRADDGRLPAPLRRGHLNGAAALPTLAFRGGTIEVTGLPPGAPAPPACLWDARTACFRAPASAYAAVRRAFGSGEGAVEDRARGYGELALGARVHREPRPYQAEALAAWRGHQGRGV